MMRGLPVTWIRPYPGARIKVQTAPDKTETITGLFVQEPVGVPLDELFNGVWVHFWIEGYPCKVRVNEVFVV